MRSPRAGTVIVAGLGVVAIAVIVAIVSPWGESAVVPYSPSSPSISDGVAASFAPDAGFDGDEGTWIHVVGEVRRPGLYRVPTGSRVVDAIMAAGGLGDAADQCGINLARPVSDGEQLVVPLRADASFSCGIAQSTGTGATAGGLISLSRSDLAALDSLPGIGPTLAQRIIDWRTANGGFIRVDQLQEVSGIGDKLFAEIAALVTP